MGIVSASDGRTVDEVDPREPQLVLLEGGHHRNKGDELMLMAARDRCRGLWPAAQLGRPVLVSTSADRVRLGLEGVLWPRSWRTLAGTLGERVIGRYSDALDLHRDEEVSAVLDVSGWSYGDRWGNRQTARAADRARSRQRRGVKTVLLPQSLGPFGDPGNAKAIARLVDAGVLVFARDEWSFEQVTRLTGPAENVRMGVDYSAELAPASSGPEVPAGAVCIVPNNRVVRETSPADRDSYVRVLAQAAHEASRRGHPPVILLHTRSQDDDVADALDAAVERVLPRVRSEDPRELKRVLGSAHAVIGSRFHALVSALTQGVPSVGIGWAPKYDALFQSFGCESLSIRASDPEGTVLDALQTILDEPSHSSLRLDLERASSRHRKQVDEMWEEVRRFVAT